ncbi:MAG TPA: VirB3 family type IV secretion system protein [Gemmatimonadales bacterium]|nr:VirB3 family type IV secretion system protein [Gemmatimonadales bacterium]
MPIPDSRHAVYKSMIRPLTVMGVERRLFFLALLLGAATFNLFYSLVGGLLVFAIVYAFARVCATVDAQMLPILLRSLAGHARYDTARHAFGSLRT